MAKNKFALLQIELPALEQSKEGKLRGGFTMSRSGQPGSVANICGNADCSGNTGTCENNGVCYNNSGCNGNGDCRGNPNCGKNTKCNGPICAVTTNTSTSTCGST